MGYLCLSFGGPELLQNVEDEAGVLLEPQVASYKRLSYSLLFSSLKSFQFSFSLLFNLLSTLFCKENILLLNTDCFILGKERNSF